MKISYINLSLILIPIIGTINYFFNGIFFGDAINFLGYYENFEYNFENNVYLVGEINTFFITFIYGFLGPISPFIINSTFLVIFWKSLGFLKLFKPRGYLDKQEKQKYIAISIIFFLLLFNPSIYLRYLEPSREFSQLLFSLLLGISLGRKCPNFARIFFSLVIVIGRPVYTPVLLLNIFICYLITKSGFKLSYKKIFVFLLLVVFIGIFNEFFSRFLNSFSTTENMVTIYDDLSQNYSGQNKTLISRMIFNIIGGINSFLNNPKADITTRTFFFIDYITRILIFAFSFRIFKINFLLLLILITLVLSLLFDFPHPRYLQPGYYLGIGFFSSYYLAKYSK